LGKPKMASPEMIRRIMQGYSDAAADHKFTLRFLLSEWAQVVDAWQLTSWEEYRAVTRPGRKTRLKEPQRLVLWSIFDGVRTRLRKRWSDDTGGNLRRVGRALRSRGGIALRLRGCR
jgi:hypothetical protein